MLVRPSKPDVEEPPVTLTSTLTKTAAALLGAAALTVTAAGVATAAPAPDEIVYEVTIEGTASGNAFSRSATLTVLPTVTDVTENGVNPYEVCLRSGFPSGTPEIGAIWYGTNTACFPDNGQALDLAVAAEDSGGFHTEPDPAVQALMVNHWTASDDHLFAFPYGPVSGGTSYRFFEDGSVQGAIELVGHGGMGGTSTYSAVLSGVRVR
jgi:hypothetical protein